MLRDSDREAVVGYGSGTIAGWVEPLRNPSLAVADRVMGFAALL
jgi:hypothetical protein